jgi:hypothetical protein
MRRRSLVRPAEPFGLVRDEHVPTVDVDLVA